MVELIGFLLIVISIAVLYPFIKQRDVEKEKLPFDKDLK